jgi:hypothetical protein
MDKHLPPDIQDMTSSASHFRVFGSSIWAHIMVYCLYDPSNTNVIFDEVSIYRSARSIPLFFMDDSFTDESQPITMDLFFPH